MRLAIVGTGYVGLVTGTCFADCGNTVVCIDKDASKIDGLLQGKIPIYEPGLQELVERNAREGRLSFTTDLPKGISAAEVVFVCVGTPQSADGSADLSIVFEVIRSIGEHVNGPKIVVIKSTVPVGTNDRALEMLKHAKHPVSLASNPEFLKEGAAIDDCLRPDRIVVGVREQATADTLKTLYAPFLRTEKPFLMASSKAARCRARHTCASALSVLRSDSIFSGVAITTSPSRSVTTSSDCGSPAASTCHRTKTRSLCSPAFIPSSSSP